MCCVNLVTVPASAVMVLWITTVCHVQLRNTGHLTQIQALVTVWKVSTITLAQYAFSVTNPAKLALVQMQLSVLVALPSTKDLTIYSSEPAHAYPATNLQAKSVFSSAQEPPTMIFGLVVAINATIPVLSAQTFPNVPAATQTIPTELSHL